VHQALLLSKCDQRVYVFAGTLWAARRQAKPTRCVVAATPPHPSFARAAQVPPATSICGRLTSRRGCVHTHLHERDCQRRRAAQAPGPSSLLVPLQRSNVQKGIVDLAAGDGGPQSWPRGTVPYAGPVVSSLGSRGSDRDTTSAGLTAGMRHAWHNKVTIGEYLRATAMTQASRGMIRVGMILTRKSVISLNLTQKQGASLA
jgi:hypothetical protein